MILVQTKKLLQFFCGGFFLSLFAFPLEGKDLRSADWMRRRHPPVAFPLEGKVAAVRRSDEV